MLRGAYNTEGPQQEFHSAVEPPSIGPPDDPAVWLAYERRDIGMGVNELRSLIERLELHDVSSNLNRRSESPSDSRTVFVVHGRDEGLREEFARALERLRF